MHRSMTALNGVSSDQDGGEGKSNAVKILATND
jgi:hypothetical protein